MIIDAYTPFARSIVVIKDGISLGGVIQRVNTKTKQYVKIVSLTEFKEGNYDRIVMCPEIYNVPKLYVEQFQEAGIEILTVEEMEEILEHRLPR